MSPGPSPSDVKPQNPAGKRLVMIGPDGIMQEIDMSSLISGAQKEAARQAASKATAEEVCVDALLASGASKGIELLKDDPEPAVGPKPNAGSHSKDVSLTVTCRAFIKLLLKYS